VSGGYLYGSREECEAANVHLTDCDDDGYCNLCGEQDTVAEVTEQAARDSIAREMLDEQNALAQKMDKLLLVCEAAREDGWTIAPTGETVAFEHNCCCPIGALAIVAGLDNADTALSELTIKIFGVSNAWAYDFMRGFDGPEYAEAAGPHEGDLAYNYGKAFRGLYATPDTA
jgi:hypothetical protein